MKKFLKLMAFVLLLALSLGCLAACSGGDKEEAVDTEEINGFVISVVNKIEDEKVVDTYGTITAYNGEEKSITLPTVTPKGMKIKAVSGLAFYKKDITSVTVPEGFTIIDNFAFGYCERLTDVILPSSIQKIGDYAFVNCYELRRVKITATAIPQLGSYAFKNFVKDSKEDDPYEISDKLGISVPDVNAYKSEKHWSDYADCLKKL